MLILVYGLGLLLAGLLTINSIFSYQAKHVDPGLWPMVWFQLKLLPLMFLSNVMIAYGVKYLYKAFGNLTFALSVSKGLEIGICVLMGYLFLKEVPTWRTYAGLTLVVGGFVMTRWR
ncbi:MULTISPECIES: hypothetical protein [Paenibacillus]|uniref:hypothetical protein n=1 Tax=Paenibacillus TaxID=44249 RepID=UPI0022B8D9AE|nr:hypothetical protein [Paenibacillus caseinilyticus]MCZ8520758.1 hypothetical protein [Paenibacillus caseinilyticus]